MDAGSVVGLGQLDRLVAAARSRYMKMMPKTTTSISGKRVA